MAIADKKILTSYSVYNYRSELISGNELAATTLNEDLPYNICANMFDVSKKDCDVEICCTQSIRPTKFLKNIFL